MQYVSARKAGWARAVISGQVLFSSENNKKLSVKSTWRK